MNKIQLPILRDIKKGHVTLYCTILEPYICLFKKNSKVQNGENDQSVNTTIITIISYTIIIISDPDMKQFIMKMGYNIENIKYKRSTKPY